MRPISDPILIVDDDQLWLAIAESALAKAGFTTIASATDGQQAMAKINDPLTEFKVVVSDLNMPDMDGILLIRAMAEAGYTGDLIVISGETEAIINAARRQTAVLDLNLAKALKKPVHPHALVDAVKSTPTAPKEKSNNSAVKLDSMDVVRIITEQQITSHFQPQYGFKNGQILGCEALARWQHGDGDPLPAGAFVPALIEHGYALALFDIVLKQCIAAMKAWEREGIIINCAVNMAPTLLEDRELPDRIATILRNNSLGAHRLTIELTEQSTIVQFDSALEVLTRIRMLGVGLSLDDFGIEASNFDRLMQIPFSEIKIDQSLVRGCVSDTAKQATIAAIVAIGQQHDMLTVAEGIENIADFEQVAELNVDYGQGFFISRPQSADHIAAETRRLTGLAENLAAMPQRVFSL